MLHRTTQPSPAPLVVIRDSRPDAEVLHLFGDADIATSGELEKAIDDIDTPSPIIVDLTECAFIDTTVITILVRAAKRLGGSSRFRLVVAPHSHIDRVLGIVQLQTFTSVTHSVEEALAV